MIITLKDGSKKEYPNGITCAEITKGISEGLYRVAMAVKVNEKLMGLSEIVNEDCQFDVLTFKDADGALVYRHTCSHILAQAVKTIYPTCHLAIGPAISNGFYYDFDFKTPLTQDDFIKIETEMSKIIKADFPIERFTLNKDEAIALMNGFDEPYKVEMIKALPDGEEISFYKQGGYVDFCRGPHLESTGKIKAFKLTSIAGAYWKGNEKNKMLTRIYGTAFEKKSLLDEYLIALEEAKNRDHNKLGRELGIFTTDERVGQGLPLLMPKGAKLMQILQRFVEDEEARRGYQLTKTPLMAKSALYKVSGHWDHYRDGMFVMGDEEKGEEVFALRPMTCPFQYIVYNTGIKSYRDLPVRYDETSTIFRNEASGEMHGLIRVRQFTISEGHLMCTPEQLESEFKGVLDLIKYMLKCIGLENDVSYRFSKWDPNDTAKYINEPETWNKAQDTMRKILDHLNISYTEAVGEAAFYGPKLDIQIKNVHGKEDTIITVQVDMFLAKNFDMVYIDENGEKKRPYIIHRTSIGCYERTLALLIEKYAGAFPLWMSPVQVKVLTLTDRTIEYAENIAKQLSDMGIRVELDKRSEKIGYKIREAQLEKIPYMLILGDKESEMGKVAVRSRNEGDLGVMETEDFIKKIIFEDKTKKL